VVVGFGLTVSTILTLFVVPSVYWVVDSISSKIMRKTGEFVMGAEEG
jgi:Cu/Ag efflux pump CusA